MGSLRWPVAAVHLSSFLTLSLAWMSALGLSLALWMLLDGADMVDPDAMTAHLGAGGLGAFTILQMAGLAALSLGLSLFVSPGERARLSVPRGDVRARLHRAFPLSAPPVWIVVALLGGFTIWTLPSFIAQELMPYLPDYPSTAELLDRLLRTAPLVGRVTIVVAIVVSAPLFEELIFRGYLWRVLEAGLGSLAALVGTTLLFALFHMDPVQSVALLPIAFFLGWLRGRSGSIVPSMVVHLMNNGLGVLLTYASPSEPDSLGLGFAIAGAAATGVFAGLGVWVSRRVPEPAVP